MGYASGAAKAGAWSTEHKHHKHKHYHHSYKAEVKGSAQDNAQVVAPPPAAEQPIRRSAKFRF